MRINEITRVERYYQQNPDRLQRYDLTPPKGADKNRAASSNNYSRIGDEKTAFENKWKEALGAELYKKVFSRGGDLSYDFRYANKRADGDFEKFIDAFGQDVYLSDQEVKQLAQSYNAIVKSHAALEKRIQGIEGANRARFQKNATKAGMSASDYRAVQDWITHFTSMSRKQIPKEIWPALQKLTVIPSRLPKTVYRGLFFDGAKIKDREKWLERWSPGNKPNVKPTKIQSWSTSIGVATGFMSAQDFVKDEENGFAVLLKYDITDPSVVIADLRNLKDSAFWNQQEIVLSPAARDYEVVAAMPYEDYIAQGKDWKDTDLYRYKEKHGAPGAGVVGNTRNELLVNNFFDIHRLQIDPAEKEAMKEVTKMTVGAAKKKFNLPGRFIDEIETQFTNTLMPLYALSLGNYSYVNDNWKIQVDRVRSKNAIDAHLTFSPGFRKSYADPVFQQLFGEEPAFGEHLYLPVTITLTNNEYNSMKFTIEKTGDFFVGKQEEPVDSPVNQKLKADSKINQQLNSNVKSALDNYKRKNVQFKLVDKTS